MNPELIAKLDDLIMNATALKYKLKIGYSFIRGVDETILNKLGEMEEKLSHFEVLARDKN